MLCSQTSLFLLPVSPKKTNFASAPIASEIRDINTTFAEGFVSLIAGGPSQRDYKLLIALNDNTDYGVKPWEIPVGMVPPEKGLGTLNKLPLHIHHDPDFSKNRDDQEALLKVQIKKCSILKNFATRKNESSGSSRVLKIIFYLMLVMITLLCGTNCLMKVVSSGHRKKKYMKNTNNRITPTWARGPSSTRPSVNDFGDPDQI